MFFDGFTLTRIRVRDGEMRVRHGGSGPSLLLLHSRRPIALEMGNRSI